MKTSSSRSAVRRCAPCVYSITAFVLIALMNSCIQLDSNHNPGSSSNQNSDADVQYDAGISADADAGLGDIDAGIDWDSCVPISFRWLNNDEALFTVPLYMDEVTVVVEDASTFEQLWHEFYAHTSFGPPLVDFADERVGWYSLWLPIITDIAEPEVRDCGDVIVFRPTIGNWGGEYPSVAVTVIALERMSKTIVFGDPIPATESP